MYCITAALWVYAVFHEKIDAFCAHGFGHICKVLFLAGSVLFIGCMLLVHVLGNTATATGQEQTLIVLGAGLRGEHVTGLLARRLDAAYDYYQKNPDVLIVVSGGQGPGESIPEAVAMERYLVQRGIPDSQIWAETESTSTEENFLFSQKLLQEHGIGPVSYTHLDVYKRQAQYRPHQQWSKRIQCKGKCITDGHSEHTA